MIKQPFLAKYLYNELTIRKAGNDVNRIGNTLFNSKIKLTPHQIEAALFAFNSPLSKGAILADEVGLGKTIEAGIVLAQLWSEHKRKIMIVAPASLMRQWAAELLEKFNLPTVIMDRKNYVSLKKKGIENPFATKNKIIICSYQMCALSKDDIERVSFDAIIIDEAHKLRNVWTGKNIISQNIKDSLRTNKILLLTATPIQNSVLDVYGLSTIIDENIFGDNKIYKEKYIKEYARNKQELRERLGCFMHRTLREQVTPYIRFTKRIPKTYYYENTEDERYVYDSIRELLQNPDENSYLIPKKQKHLLLLILCKLMGSSIHSIVYTLEAMKNRLIKLRDTGIDEELPTDIVSTDEIEDLEEIDLEEDQEKVNINEINREIFLLEDIIKKAKSINIENKYLKLKEALSYGFSHLKKLGANEKVLIFTESTRTQKYLYDSLINDGYKGVLQFNGSNNDELSKNIYEEWAARECNQDKLKNSKSVNMRQAIIDKFKESGQILIATEAGAEGLNLQFCSMVVNYDLPWNPQLVEQRIGRCHRFGQAYDVVVINFISKDNVVEQRIFELLSIKFKIFEEILGTSDTILGALEDGKNLQKSIIDIYTKCRTKEEINSAFDEIQEQYKDTIDASMKKTRKDLLDNFDEDLQNYFSDIMDSANNQISKIEKVFWGLTKCILDEVEFNEDKYTFEYKGDKYCLSTKNDGSFIDYNMGTDLGKFVLAEAERINDLYGSIIFDLSNYKYKMKDVQSLIGKQGYLIVSKLQIESYETEEYLVLNAFTEKGKPIEEDTIEKLFRLETKEKVLSSLQGIEVDKLLEDNKQHCNKFIIESQNKNNEYLNAEIVRINKWADDKIESIQLDVENMRNQRKELQKQSDLAENTAEKEKFENEIVKLSRKIKQQWLVLADQEDEIEGKRKAMIEKIRKENMKSTKLEPLIIVNFMVN